jgi:hypothetical protein
VSCNHCSTVSTAPATAAGAPDIEASWAENREHPQYCPTCHAFLRADGGCTRCETARFAGNLAEARQHLESDPHLAAFMVRDLPEMKEFGLDELAWATFKGNPTRNDVEFLLEELEAAHSRKAGTLAMAAPAAASALTRSCGHAHTTGEGPGEETWCTECDDWATVVAPPEPVNSSPPATEPDAPAVPPVVYPADEPQTEYGHAAYDAQHDQAKRPAAQEKVKAIRVSMRQVFGDSGDGVVKSLEKAFAEGRDFSFSLPGDKRTRSVDVRRQPDGSVKAWFSSAPTGRVNGDNYLLLNPYTTSFKNND